MGRINPYNSYLYSCGIGGGGQVIKVKNILTKEVTTLAGPEAGGATSTGGPTWFDGKQVIGQLCPNCCLMLVTLGGDIDRLINDGINHSCAGGGNYAAITIHNGNIVNGIRVDYEPIIFGSNGSLAFTYQSHQGLYLKTHEGVAQYSSAVVDIPNVSIIDADGEDILIWLENQKIKCSDPSFQNILNLPGEYGWLRAVVYRGLLLVMYQHFTTNRIIVHPFNSLVGWVLGEGNCYYNDIANLPDKSLLAIWNTVANDSYESMVEVTDFQFKTPIDLMTLIPPVPVSPIDPPIPPIPDPKPDPGPIPVPPKPKPEPVIKLIKELKLMDPEIVSLVCFDHYARVVNGQVLFDQTVESQETEWEISKPDDKFAIIPLSDKSKFLSADSTTYGTNICKQFALADSRGNYESWFIGIRPSGLIEAVIEYISQGVNNTVPLSSAAITIKRKK